MTDKKEECQGCIGLTDEHKCEGYDAFQDMLKHNKDQYSKERLTRYERALEEILEKAPANGEDVSYLIAKRALENK